MNLAITERQGGDLGQGIWVILYSGYRVSLAIIQTNFLVVGAILDSRLGVNMALIYRPWVNMADVGRIEQV